jgi:tetratricopeptide (TPR) repeat protein
VSNAETFYNRGVAFYGQGRFTEALADQDSALLLAPGHPNIQLQRGLCLRRLGYLDDALAAYDAALARLPRDSEIHTNRGNVLHDLHRHAEAVAAFDAALAADPRNAGAWSNRGAALIQLQRPPEALASFERALALAPANPEYRTGRGVALRELGRLDEALADFAACAGFALADWNRGVTLLLKGDFAAGWPLYEARKRLTPPVEARSYPQPLFTGAQDIKDKSLFLYAGQGLGDTIQFVRFIAPLAGRGARVILSAQDALRPLLADAATGAEIIGADEIPSAFDYHAPLASLPPALGGDLLPGSVPYLRADPARVARWKETLGAGFKVGIAWRGAIGGQPGRAIPPEHFAALAMPGVRLIGLHRDAAAPGVETLAGLDDDGAFLDTAAVMMTCDLIITLDSAPAHLAGGLGVPAWVALRAVPDWRWLLERGDSPWYPSLTLWRQSAPGDWAGVFKKMRTKLQGMTA